MNAGVVIAAITGGVAVFVTLALFARGWLKERAIVNTCALKLNKAEGKRDDYKKERDALKVEVEAQVDEFKAMEASYLRKLEAAQKEARRLNARRTDLVATADPLDPAVRDYLDGVLGDGLQEIMSQASADRSSEGP